MWASQEPSEDHTRGSNFGSGLHILLLPRNRIVTEIFPLPCSGKRGSCGRPEEIACPGGGAKTHSLVMRYKSGTVRFIEAIHCFDRNPIY